MSIEAWAETGLDTKPPNSRAPVIVLNSVRMIVLVRDVNLGVKLPLGSGLGQPAAE